MLTAQFTYLRRRNDLLIIIRTRSAISCNISSTYRGIDGKSGTSLVIPCVNFSVTAQVTFS